MQQSGRTALIVPAMLAALTIAPAYAEVEIDLSAIGASENADARIAPGRAPVQLRYPGETSPTRIILTPPPSLRQAQDRAEKQLPPTLLGPSDAVEVQPAATRPAPPAPSPQQQSAFPDPATIEAAPSLPIERTQLQPATDTANAPSIARVPDASAPPPDTATETTAPTAQSGAPEQPVQVASLPAPKPVAHRLGFESSNADILGATREELELVATELMRHDDRIEIQAYAGAAGDVSSDARRLSLKRGLNVRKFLVENGVLQSRIDVRALGGVRDSGPSQRVDILLSRR